MTNTHCTQCNAEFIPNGCSPGYGTDCQTNQRYCFDCCAGRGLKSMRETGKATLYLTNDVLTDWPGKLRFEIRHKRTSRNNWGAPRTDVWFVLDGAYWNGVHVGNSHQLCNVKRTKSLVNVTAQ